MTEEPMTAAGSVNPSGESVSVHTIENHDEAYYLWKEAGFRQQTLVHVDAHHDIWWINPRDPITIANFICPAVREGIVNDVYWVVPDATFETRTGRTAVRKHLSRILRGCANNARPLFGDRLVTAEIPGGRLTICTFETLPDLSGPVLLDIDTDYLLIPWVYYSRDEEPHPPLPWRWPDELMRCLQRRSISPAFCTVAYSVEGGYTPLEWKFLGDEIALRLRHPEGHPALRGMEELGRAARATVAGDALVVQQALLRAREDLPLSAAPWFRLSYLRMKNGDAAEARECYRRALELDPSYRTAYSHSGYSHLLAGRLKQADRCFATALQLDPDDPYAAWGAARVAMRKRHWTMAERLLGASLALLPDFFEAHRALAETLEKLGRDSEAITHYETCLRLALKGHSPVFGAIATGTGKRRLLDGEHALTHARVARLYARAGQSARAINAYRIAVFAKCDSAENLARLAILYWKQGQFRKALTEFSRGACRVPRDIMRNASSSWRGVKHHWRGKCST